MRNNILLIGANGFNWSIVILAIIDDMIPWFTIAGITAAIVVSILTALKLRSDYLVNKGKLKTLRTEQKLKDQQLINEQLITKRMLGNDTDN